MENIQSKESLPYWFETEEWKDFSKLAESNFGGKPKMETLEESLLQIRKTPMTFEPKQERMYSEEDMQEYSEFCIRLFMDGTPCIIAKDWLEQFKKNKNGK